MRLFTDRSARVRLALIYSGVFLALGIALILVILVATRTGSSVSVATPFSGARAHIHITPPKVHPGHPPAPSSYSNTTGTSPGCWWSV